MNFGVILSIVKGVWKLFLDFIGFLFDLDLNEKPKEPEKPFPELSQPVKINNNATTLHAKDNEIPEAFFDDEAAEFIIQLREEVDFLVKEHGLQRKNSILTVLPPQKLSENKISVTTINGVIENIYSQFDGDVILRPGRINVFVNDSGVKFAEMYIDTYKPQKVEATN